MFKMRTVRWSILKHRFSKSLRIFSNIICIWENPQNLLSVTLSFPAHLLADYRGDNETVAIHSSGEIPCHVHQSVEIVNWLIEHQTSQKLAQQGEFFEICQEILSYFSFGVDFFVHNYNLDTTFRNCMGKQNCQGISMAHILGAKK